MRILLPTVALLTIMFAVSCSRTDSSSVDSQSAAVAQQMAAPDDFDSTKNKVDSTANDDIKRPKYNAYTPNEAIDLMKSLPDADKYMSGILPQMSQECLDYAMRLLNDDHGGFIIVDKQAMKVVLYDKYGREQLRYGIACARNYGTKQGKGDCRTPEGFFSVEGIYDSTDWLYRSDNGYVSKKKGQFGPRFIRLAIPTTSQIGIHGTCAPGSIGGRVSHGCIRVTNENILELVKHVRPGMPVIVSPSVRDQKVNAREGHNIPWVSVNGGSRPSIDDIVEPAAPKAKPTQKPESVPTDTVAPAAEPAPATTSEHPDTIA